MLRKRTKKDYLVPRSAVTEVDLEGVICESNRVFIQADESQNMNRTRNGVAHDGPGTEHYFEF